jgi:hypothetical protein
MSIVGGLGDADSSTLPSLEIASTLGGEGWICGGGRSSVVVTEYAWMAELSVVVK